jgi:phosphotriesterase-related protein
MVKTRLLSERIDTMAGKVRTVLGDVRTEDLGIVLMHEHILWDLRFYCELPPQATKRKLARGQIDISNLGELRRNPFAIWDNLLQDDVDLAIDELKRFRWAGGKTVVDANCTGMGGDVAALRRIALETGVNIITGCGYYIDPSHPAGLKAKGVDEICRDMIHEIANGRQGTGIKPGIIGEIGTSQSLTDGEEKVLRAAANTQIETGLPIYVHPYFRDGKYHALKSLDILDQEGADLNRVVMCHMDGNLDFDYHKQVAERGVYIEYDTFGKEYTRTDLNYELPKDTHRVKMIVKMLEAGFDERILVSHDICFKMDLHRYGGWGYDHIPDNIIPMFRQAGMDDDTIREILEVNPARVLTIAE